MVRIIGPSNIFILKSLKQGTRLSSYGFTDSIGLPTDTINSLIFGKNIFDNVTVSDSINTSGTLAQILQDSSIILDLVGVDDGITYGLHKYFYDQISVLDSTILDRILGTPPEQDSVGALESHILGFGKFLSDSLITSELSTFSLSAVKTDLVEAIEIALLDVSKSLSDSSSSGDLVKITTNKNFTDSSSITETSVYELGKFLSESLLSSELPILSVSLVKTDSAAASEFVTLSPNKILVDSIASPTDAIDNIVFGKNIFDNATALDLVLVPDGLTYSIAKSIADALNATEVFQRQVDFSRGFTDSSTATESISLLAEFDRIFADSSTVTENSVYSVGKFLSDSSTATESVSLLAEFDRIFSDSSNVTETTVYNIGKFLSDSSTATESVLLFAEFDRIFADSTTATESILVSQGWVRSFADSASVSDTQLFVSGKGLRFDSDFILAIDSGDIFLSQGWGRPTGDSTSATEEISLVAEFNRLFADSSTATESTIFTIGLALEDSATIVDLVGVPDLATYTLGKDLSDSIDPPTDDINNFVFGKFLNDSSVITETSVYTFGMFKNNEILSPIDLIVFNVGAKLADSSTIAQAIILQTSLTKSDSSIATDDGLISLQNYFAEEYVTFTSRYVETSNTVF
jgi:hypothetical protein